MRSLSNASFNTATGSGSFGASHLIPAPAGSLSASGEDMARFMIAQLQGGRFEDRAILRAAFDDAMSRSAVVLATGGLGPTHDDLSREGLADALGEELGHEVTLAGHKSREAGAVELLAGDPAAAERELRPGCETLDRLHRLERFHLPAQQPREPGRGGLMANGGPTEKRRAILDDIAWPERAQPETAPGVEFFNRFRDMTAAGFFSSAMGWRDLQYIGNVYLTSWRGCPDECMKALGVSHPTEP